MPAFSRVQEYTLDESIWKTIWRDIVTIARNLRLVLVPVNWKFTGQAAALRNWDLWGPLVSGSLVAFVRLFAASFGARGWGRPGWCKRRARVW